MAPDSHYILVTKFFGILSVDATEAVPPCCSLDLMGPLYNFLSIQKKLMIFSCQLSMMARNSSTRLVAT